MQSHIDCSRKSDGLKQSDIFKLCGFDWGDKNKARSTQQQYWVIALLRELESEGQIEQVNESGPWRLKNKQGST
jgi:hypothetical protein